MKASKFLGLLLLSSLLLSPIPAASASTDVSPVPQEFWSEKRIQSSQNRSAGETTVQISEGAVQPFQTSHASYTNNLKLGSYESQFCESFKVAPCDQASRLTSANEFGKPRVFAQVMPKSCISESDNFCIESIIENDGSASHALELIEEINPPHWSASGKQTTSQIEGDPANGVPSGGSESTLWRNSKTGKSVLSSGNLYFHFEAGKIVLQQFSLKLMDVMVVESASYQVDPDRSVTNLPVNRSWNGYRCLYTLPGKCLVYVMHAQNSSYEVKIRTPKTFKGWFGGRMTEPQISLTKGKDYVVYKFQGKPALIPQAWGNVPKAKCLDLYCPDYLYFDTKLADFSPWPYNFSGQTIPSEYKTNPWDLFVALFDDRATNLSTDWSVSLVTGWGNTSCFGTTDEVSGFFTSNAMVYSGTPPSFRDGAFEYQVAGLHFQPDGVTPVEGTFDLLIKSEVARCLYGFTSAPISATISVVEGGVTKSVATKVVSEKDGWLRYTAAGFTFSAPKIQIKLTQSKPSSKKTTIVCVKNKSVKRVSGFSPRCPAGFKKR